MNAMKDIRHNEILARVRAAKAVSVAELAAATHSSIATIRRDLKELDDEGRLRRTHGGAIVTEGDSPFSDVEAVNSVEKARIARAAAATIADGQSVMLDIGTTTAQLARLLAGRPITVITPSLAVYDVLRDDRTTRLVLLPGDYDPVYRCVAGPLTVECMRMVHVDLAFLGVSGIGETGDLRDTTLGQIPIKQAMMDVSDHVSVLADASKFPGTGAGLIAPRRVGSVITDAPPPAAVAAALAARGIEVTVA